MVRSMPRGTLPTICFGLAVTTTRPQSGDRLSEFCDALGLAAGVEVRSLPATSYDDLLQAITSGNVDLAWLPPVVALRAAARGSIKPIAIPARRGVASYGAALYCRQGSPITSVEELNGARVGWVDRNSASGYVLIRALLRSRGIDLARAFASEEVLGGHDAVRKAVQSGAVDVGATFINFDGNGEDARIVYAGWRDDDVRVLMRSEAIASDVVAANTLLPGHVIAALQDALISCPDDLADRMKALFDADDLLRPTPDHIQHLRDLTKWID